MAGYSNEAALLKTHKGISFDERLFKQWRQQRELHVAGLSNGKVPVGFWETAGWLGEQ